MTTIRNIQAELRERVLPAGANRHGLVIGIEKYRDSRLNLRCARADAQAIYDLMVDPECGLFPKDNVHLLLDGQTTLVGIRQELSRLRTRVGPRDTLWVYFAGHAAKEGERAFWLNCEADIDDLYATAIDAEFVSEALGQLQADRLLLFMDCCHAAAFEIQKTRTRKAVSAEELLAGYAGTGRVIMASSNRDEEAVESGAERRGVFTYFLEKGLKGEADLNQDGVVTADELWAYLNRKVADAARQQGRSQTPVLKGEQTHQLALTLNKARSQARQRVRTAIKERLGFGPEDLTPEEAGLCLQIVEQGPQSEVERDVEAEFEALADGTIRIKTFKRAVQLAGAAREDRDVPEFVREAARLKDEAERQRRQVQELQSRLAEAQTGLGKLALQKVEIAQKQSHVLALQQEARADREAAMKDRIAAKAETDRLRALAQELEAKKRIIERQSAQACEGLRQAEAMRDEAKNLTETAAHVRKQLEMARRQLDAEKLRLSETKPVEAPQETPSAASLAVAGASRIGQPRLNGADGASENALLCSGCGSPVKLTFNCCRIVARN